MLHMQAIKTTNTKLANLCSIIEEHGNDDENERQTEVDVEVQMKDENRQRRRDEHSTWDEKQSCDVACMFHHRRHDQPNEGLDQRKQTSTSSLFYAVTG